MSKLCRAVLTHLVLFLCLAKATRITKRQIESFRCDDNNTINSYQFCDGQPDCPDGSDESSICQKVVCDADHVKCDYGACVKDLSKCYSNVSTGSETQSAFCINNDILLNGVIWKVSNRKVRIGLNAMVENFAQIEYTCSPNHYIIGNATNFCDNGKWLYKTPECQPRCSPYIIDNISFSAKCYVTSDGPPTIEVPVRCSELAVPGTIASFSCKWGYERTNTELQVSTCDENGQWSPLPSVCTQYCGEEAPEGTSFIVGGDEADIKKVPWHVGVYYQKEEKLVQVCGGTIISPKVVVSAAHCFWDVFRNDWKPKSEFRIVAGKYFRDLNDPRENNTFQILALHELYRVDGYWDYAGLYADDIVVLVLSNFIVYNVNVGPICIESYKFEEKVVPADSIGRVAGWGLTASSGKPSDRLKQIDLPVVPRQMCLREFDQNFRPFLTSDKFCAGELTGVGVCRGDSGGGLVFPKTVNGKTLYYLRGVVSSGPNKMGSCDNDKYALFTNTAYFWDLIERHFILNRPTIKRYGYTPIQISTTTSEPISVIVSNRLGSEMLNSNETEALVTEKVITEALVTEKVITEALVTETAITEVLVTKTPTKKALVTERAITQASIIQNFLTCSFEGNIHELKSCFYVNIETECNSTMIWPVGSTVTSTTLDTFDGELEIVHTCHSHGKWLPALDQPVPYADY